MISNWEDFEERRAISLTYHKHNGESAYLVALNYFENMRKYFQKNGFPEPKTEKFQAGARKGQIKPYTEKESKQQIEDIQEFIKNERLGKFRAVRGSRKNSKR